MIRLAYKTEEKMIWILRNLSKHEKVIAPRTSQKTNINRIVFDIKGRNDHLY